LSNFASSTPCNCMDENSHSTPLASSTEIIRNPVLVTCLFVRVRVFT
jgi:hypothetical protein